MGFGEAGVVVCIQHGWQKLEGCDAKLRIAPNSSLVVKAGRGLMMPALECDATGTAKFCFREEKNLRSHEVVYMNAQP